MPNHFRLVVWPNSDGDLGVWMSHVMNFHVRAHRKRWRTAGHIWQGRFKAFPIQQDHHLITVRRYVELNLVAARLVGDAAQWRWSSAYLREAGETAKLNDGPVPLPDDWLVHSSELASSTARGPLTRHVSAEIPFGSPEWTKNVSARLGLPARVNGRGRPIAL